MIITYTQREIVMAKRSLGLVGLILGVFLTVPALADDTSPASSTQPTPSATGNLPVPQNANPNNMPRQRQDIRNDAQNYREAMENNNNATPNMNREEWREKQKERQERMRKEREE